MGEARKRGTREQRVAEGIAKRQAAEAKREAEWREYQRTRRPSAATAMLGVIAAAEIMSDNNERIERYLADLGEVVSSVCGTESDMATDYPGGRLIRLVEFRDGEEIIETKELARLRAAQDDAAAKFEREAAVKLIGVPLYDDPRNVGGDQWLMATVYMDESGAKAQAKILRSHYFPAKEA